MYYLKRVMVLLEWEDYRESFEILEKNLEQGGIMCEICRLRDADADGFFRVQEKACSRDSGEPAKGILWITDSAAMAKKLWECGYLVAAFLHEQNEDADFSVCSYALEKPEEADGDCLDRILRRLQKLPWDILETERCLIRETTEEDVDAFYRIYAEPSITKFMEPLYEDPEEERAYARDYRDQVYSFYEFGIWTVTEKVSGEVIGRAGICYREGYEDPELGFVIGVPRQGQGYATEVCSEVLAYAGRELHFERILAFVQPENAVSRHLCGKLGMREVEKVVLQEKEYLILEARPAVTVDIESGLWDSNIRPIS